MINPGSLFQKDSVFSSGLLRISRARRMFRLLRFLQMFRLGLLVANATVWTRWSHLENIFCSATSGNCIPSTVEVLKSTREVSNLWEELVVQASENRLEMLGKEPFFAPIASVFGSLNCHRVSIRLGVMQSDIGMIFRPVFNVTGSLNIARVCTLWNATHRFRMW